MGIVYLFVSALVICLLLAIPLFPFWKVWKRVRDHHPDIWASKGPFDLRSLVSGTGALRDFMTVVSLADRDEELIKQDAVLVKWARIAREVWKMMPRSFFGQVGAFLIFLYFVGFFTSLVMRLFS